MAAASLLLPSDARLGSLIPRGTPSGRGTTCSPPPPWSGATIVGGGGDDVVDKRHRGHHDARRRKRDTDAAQRPLPAPCSRRRRVVARCFGWVDSESGRPADAPLPLSLLPFFPRAAASCRGMRCRIAEIAVAVALVSGGLDGGPRWARGRRGSPRRGGGTLRTSKKRKNNEKRRRGRRGREEEHANTLLGLGHRPTDRPPSGGAREGGRKSVV